jgi:hypothetical protein
MRTMGLRGACDEAVIGTLRTGPGDAVKPGDWRARGRMLKTEP